MKDDKKRLMASRTSKGLSVALETSLAIEQEACKAGMPQGRFVDWLLIQYKNKQEKEDLETSINKEGIRAMYERLKSLEDAVNKLTSFLEDDA